MNPSDSPAGRTHGRRRELRCFRCHETKAAEHFPIGRSGKRRSSVCMTCVETQAHELYAFKLAKWATWLDPKTGRVTRRCYVCHETKDLERDFYGKAKALPGSKHKRANICKPCTDERIRAAELRRIEKTRARRRVAQLRYQKRHPERVLARRKRYWQSVKSDPERHAKVLEDHRIARTLRLERAGRRPNRRASNVISIAEPRPPRSVAPLVVEILQLVTCGNTIEELCEKAGITSRTFRRWRTGEIHDAKLAVAERAALGLGLDAEVLWPDVEGVAA